MKRAAAGRLRGWPMLAAGIAAMLAASCASPQVQTPVGPASTPGIAPKSFRMDDGAKLPYRVWPARGRVRAVLVALHGMNDYRRAFVMPAATWRERGITVYAFDQRGFGAAPAPGIWAGTKRLIADLRTVVRLVRTRHPGVPVYVLGESMGGAVVAAAMGRADAPRVAGTILVAPAIWAWAAMPARYRWSLELAVHTVPWMRLTGKNLGRRPTDNLVAWRATGRDPLVIKGARVDALWGVVQLFDRAWASAGKIRGRLLLLYGAKDQIVPKLALVRLIERLPRASRTFAYYRNGWHWLVRDLGRWDVHDDVSSWMLKPGRPLPSNAATAAARRLLKDHGRRR